MANTPVILTFQIRGDAGHIYADTGLTLEWDVRGADELMIDGMLQPPGASELRYDCLPPGSRTFMLSASASGGRVTKAVKVDVLPPVVMALLAEPSVVAPGETATLVWEARSTMGLCRLSCGDKTETVEAKGYKTVMPEGTAYYTLSAAGSDGSRSFSQSLKVTVAEHCQVEFSASHDFTLQGVPVVLRWEVVNADSVTLDGFGTQESCGQMTVNPEQEITDYCLRVRDAFGEHASHASVRLLPVPLIEELLVPLPDIRRTVAVRVSTPQIAVTAQPPMVKATPPIVTERHVRLTPSSRAFLKRLDSGPRLLRPRLFRSLLTRWLGPLFGNKKTD